MGRPATSVAALSDPIEQITQRLRGALQSGNETGR